MPGLKNTLQTKLEKNLFNKAQHVKALLDFLNNTKDEKAYNAMRKAMDIVVKNTQPAAISVGGSKARLLCTLADGTVFYDSGSKVKNSFSNYKSKSINENHQSRSAIQKAILSDEGLGWEAKFSTSTNSYEQYVAMRVGMSQHDAMGVVRLSFK